MKTVKKTKTENKYDENWNVTEQIVTEEIEAPELDCILCRPELEDDECCTPCFDQELTASRGTNLVDIIFSVAGIVSIIASALSIRRLLKQ